MPRVQRSVRIPNRQGLHARPIKLLADTAARHRASLRVRCRDVDADGRKVMELMTLEADQGTVLELLADGDDAEALLAAVAALVEGGFGEQD